MRRLVSALLVSLIGVLMFYSVVLAAWEYYFPTTVQNSSTSAQTYYPALLGFGGTPLVNSGKIASSGLDTNMQIGTTSISYMMSTTEVGTVIPNIPASGQVTVDLYTGYTPNQTNFPVIVGDNGRFETADAAPIELAQTFNIEFDGYFDMSTAHYPLIYKPSAFLVDVSAAGTITAGAINADSYDMVPGGFASWQDIDVSNYVPASATGVVVEIDTVNNFKNTGVRKNGSTDDRRTDTKHYWTMVGIDSSQIFEVYLEDNTCHLYLRGYTDDNWTFNTNATDVSLGAVGAWTDIDVTAATEAGATGVVIEIINNDGAVDRAAGVRKNGSTDNRHEDVLSLNHTFRVIGLDSDEIFEGYIETTDVDFYLIGYVTAGATFATNATDKSLAAVAAWTDVDISTEAPGSTFAFFEVTGTAVDGIGYRENGSSDNIVTDMSGNQVQGIAKCDLAQVVEAYEQTPANTASYLAGYTEYGIYPPWPSPTYLVSVSVGGGAIPSGTHNIVVAGTGGGGNLTVDVDSGTWTGSAAIGAGITNTTNNWRFMSRAIPYLTDYYHTSTGALRITYEPAAMLTDTTVVDETTAFDGTIMWGDNQNMTVVYGTMEGYEATNAEASDVGGFDMPTSTMPSSWFGDASGIANLPAYDAFNSVAIQMGMPTQTLYFWAIIGLAFGVCLFVVVFTRSALMGVMAMVIVLFIGSSQTIIPMWIPFSILIVDIAIMYLYRQVSY